MRSLAAGFRALGHGKLILLLALATVVVAAGAAAPLHGVFVEKLGETFAGDHFLRNDPSAAPTDFFDFFRFNAGALTGALSGSRYGVLLTIVLQTFFAGGIVAVLGRGPFAFGQFFDPARRNFWHNVKCFLLFVVLLAVVFGALFGGAYAAGEKIFENVPPDAASRAAWRWGLGLLAVLLWGVLSLHYDFARAARRYAPAIGAWRAWGFARRALRGSGARALGLFVFWLVAGGAVWFGLFAAAWSMPAASPIAIFVLFLLQFLVLWVRSAIRVAAWGSYLEFLDERAARALPAAAAIRTAPVTAVPVSSLP
jgi:hypothetical protein